MGVESAHGSGAENRRQLGFGPRIGGYSKIVDGSKQRAGGGGREERPQRAALGRDLRCHGCSDIVICKSLLQS